MSQTASQERAQANDAKLKAIIVSIASGSSIVAIAIVLAFLVTSGEPQQSKLTTTVVEHSSTNSPSLSTATAPLPVAKSHTPAASSVTAQSKNLNSLPQQNAIQAKSSNAPPATAPPKQTTAPTPKPLPNVVLNPVKVPAIQQQQMPKQAPQPVVKPVPNPPAVVSPVPPISPNPPVTQKLAPSTPSSSSTTPSQNTSTIPSITSSPPPTQTPGGTPPTVPPPNLTPPPKTHPGHHQGVSDHHQQQHKASHSDTSVAVSNAALGNAFFAAESPKHNGNEGDHGNQGHHGNDGEQD